MSATALPSPAPSIPHSARDRSVTDRRVGYELVALYAASCALYILLGLLRHGPTIVPDELTYAHLGSSLAHGDGFQWGAGPVNLRAALYVYLITPSWWLSSGYGAYTIAKVIGAAAICSAVFPTYLMARSVVPGRAALVPSALVAIGTWMVAAGGILTENLAFPLAAFTLYATVQAIRHPRTAWIWIALAAAVVTTWSRYQLVILIPAILATLVFDVARSGERWRARLRDHLPPLVVAVVAAGAWGVAFLADPALVGGSYVGIGTYHPTLSEILGDAWEHSLALVLMVGIVPAIAVTAVALRRENWRDDSLGPLLATAVPFGALLIAESAFFTAGYGSAWQIDRYVEYLAPIVLVLFTAAIVRGMLPWRRMAVASAAVALALWFTPSLMSATEQRAIFGISARVHGILGTGTRTSIGLAGLVVVAIGLVLVYRYPRRAALPLALLTAVVLVAQSEASWEWQTRLAMRWNDQFPADKAWVDHHAGGPVARLIVSGNSPMAQTLEFFNHDVSQVYVPAAPATYLGNAPLAQTCPWSVSNGYVRLGAGCGKRPDRFLLDDPSARLTFYGEQVIARDPRIGSIVRVPGAQRLRSVLILPCPRPYVITDQTGGRVAMQTHTGCRGVLQGSLWLDSAATLALTFRGGAGSHIADLGTRRWVLAAGRDTTVQIPLPAGAHSLSLGLDWNDSAGAPTITAATLTSAGHRDDLL